MGEGEHLAVVGHRGIVDVRFTTGRKSRGSVEVSKSEKADGGLSIGIGIAHGVFYDAGIAIDRAHPPCPCMFLLVCP